MNTLPSVSNTYKNLKSKARTTTRKGFGLFIAMIIVLCTLTQCSKKEKPPLIVLQPLPYSENALEPYISAETLNVHYGKHHAGYVNKANTLLETSTLKAPTIEELIKLTADKTNHLTLFNSAAQAWNHAFFWNSMKPNGGGLPEGSVAQKIDKTFGSFDAFKDTLLRESNTFFGSGWVWLVLDGKELKIMTTSNADSPIAHGQIPLFTIDLWEHAYYLDYRNRRAEFLEIVLDKLINWEFVAAQLQKAEVH